ncbi:metallophosphoesterase family protein [Algoriphagus antarcticus]|uniref:3',5'-cyclic AMP phosphodiesterase CpdA n=1 Tax=Algoriphagus antarcticus TaxID=238540 RepID=A0A3E0E168_9BACT|nr:metallophosphoesterase [Algoriphagus antarcticus]REG92044.1 3',5'-cyclic AMP phosphodiesterase CpdA [Algoriphagus antarcticus]
MKRRKFLSNSAGLVVGASTPLVAYSAADNSHSKSPVLTIAHITDVHIRPEKGIPARAINWLKITQRHKPDFYLNGGDSIHDASYDEVTRQRTLEQWEVWDQFRSELQNANVYSCIGNHDPWWDAPSKEDEMYGKPYVVKRLQIPYSYYSFDQKGWHFIILDGNHEGISLGEDQMKWLENDLASLASNTPTLIMSHFPITSITNDLVGGQHSDHRELKSLFYKHKEKVRVCLSGHQHLLDRTWYNGVHYFCNGALSGFWWGDGDEHSAGKQYYLETPPGFAILKLYADGAVENEYFPMT